MTDTPETPETLQTAINVEEERNKEQAMMAEMEARQKEAEARAARREKFRETCEPVESLKRCQNLIILGKGLTNVYGMTVANDWTMDVWGVNDMEQPQLTAVFELHDEVTTADREVEKREIPVVLFHPLQGVQHPVLYPSEELAKLDYPNYFSNTICYMMALGIYLEYKTIGIYGVDYLPMPPLWFLERLKTQTSAEDYAATEHRLRQQVRTEALYERPANEFWMGYAAAKRVNLRMHEQSCLMTTAPGCRMPYAEWGETVGRELSDKSHAVGEQLAAEEEADWEDTKRRMRIAGAPLGSVGDREGPPEGYVEVPMVADEE